MTVTASPTTAGNRAGAAADAYLILVAWAGGMLGVGGVIIGLRMALHPRAGQCSNASTFPGDTSTSPCLLHPHAGEGAGLAIVAIMLMIIIVTGVWALRTWNARTSQ